MSRWICTKDCRALGVNFRQGDIFENETNPLSSCFAAYAGDVILPVNKSARTDMDGTYYFPRSGWDDLRFPATLIRQGPTTKPDFDPTAMGLLFPQNDPTEIAYIVAQMPHAMKLGSNLLPHLHFVQDEEEIPIFKIDYRWHAIGGDPTIAFTTIASSGVYVLPYVSGSINQIAVFPEIDGSAMLGTSSLIDVRVYRDDDIVSGDVVVKEFDFHYQIDSPGSGREFKK